MIAADVPYEGAVARFLAMKVWGTRAGHLEHHCSLRLNDAMLPLVRRTGNFSLDCNPVRTRDDANHRQARPHRRPDSASNISLRDSGHATGHQSAASSISRSRAAVYSATASLRATISAMLIVTMSSAWRSSCPIGISACSERSMHN